MGRPTPVRAGPAGSGGDPREGAAFLDPIDDAKSAGDALPPAEIHAQMFQRQHEAHATKVMEDYLKMTADLIDGEGEARAADLAERFGVTPATVYNTVKRLEKRGYVTSKPYRAIFLTDQGRALADRCRERHRLVHSFLIAVGVDPAVAATDAEGIEHHISDETQRAFATFLAHDAANAKGGDG